MNKWATMNLGTCCENLDKQRKPITKSKRVSGTIPYYGASGVVDHVNDFLFDEELLLVSEDGANLLARTYPIAFSISGKAWVNNHAHVLRFTDSIARRFVEYYLNSISLEPWVSGMAQPKLNQAKLNAIPIPIPPLPEQKRIVAILDEAFGAIDRAKEIATQNVANARELFESYLNRVFSLKGEGWEETCLNDVSSIESKLVDPKQDEFIDLPHIGAGNMVSQSDQLVEVLTAREEGLISNKYTFDSTMVLYSKIRPYLMKVSRPNFVGLCSADVYPLSPVKEVLHRDFLFYTLLSKDFTDYAMSGSARAGMPKVNRKHMFAYRFSLPPLEDQKRIAKRTDSLVEEARSLERIHTQKIAALDELKQSILQKAFTGQLTANSPELEAVP